MKKAKQNKISQVDEVQEDFEKSEIDSESKASEKKSRFAFLKDERLHKISGLVFTLGAAFMLISFTSFLFSWEADQTLVQNLSWDMFSEIQPDAAGNLLGKIGAWVAYVCMYKGFGIASYSFVLIALAIGIRLLTSLEPIKIFRTLKFSFFIAIWLSLAMGFIFNDTMQILGGVFGHFGFLYLKGLIGTIGTGLVLICYALIFLVAVFNIKFYQPKPITEPGSENVKDEIPNAVLENKADENEPLDPDDFQLKENKVEFLVDDVNPEEEKKNERELLIPPVIIPVISEAVIAEAATAIVENSLELEVNEVPEEEIVEENIEKPEYGSIDSKYDPTLDFSNYQFPTLDLLNDYGDSKIKVEDEELNTKKNMIVATLKNYSIDIKKISATIGPTVTLYEIVPQDGVRIAKIKNLEDDIALSLAALGIRIIAPIPGKGTIGIEVPNEKPAIVPMKGVIASAKFQNAEMDLPIAFGRNIQNEVFVADLAKMPHLLMAGATGQGKSVGLNAILVSLLYKKHPSQIKFVLVDPKKVELSIYKTIERHFLAKIPGDADAIITDTKLVVHTLNSLCVEMDLRYDLLKDAQVRNIKEYNAKFISRKLNPENGHRYLPYIVVVVDELADFLLNGVITSVIDQYKNKQTITYQINLELTNIETNEKVWIGEKQIKKFIKN